MLQIDPRVERSQRVIREAAVDELAQVGWGAFTIESVAARAGVARSTVYRHWPDKLALVLDAVENHSVQPPSPDTAVGRPRVVALVQHLAEAMADPRKAALMLALVDAAERDPALRRLHRGFNRRRRQALVKALSDSGTTDPQLTALALAGAVVYARMMDDRPLTARQAADLVDAVLGPP